MDLLVSAHQTSGVSQVPLKVRCHLLAVIGDENSYLQRIR